MKADLPAIIKRVAKFLNKEMTEEQVQLLSKHLNFQTMKSNPAVNFEDRIKRIKESNLNVKNGEFMRAGVVGKYKDELSPETIAEFNEWIDKNIRGTELGNDYIFYV